MKRISKHINPATILALVALVFATTGGAYAASGSGGSGSHATANVAKSKKKSKQKSSAGKPGPRGPAGPAGATGSAGATGAAGAQGPAGPAGAPGTKGDAGAAGTDGNDGTNGTNGTNGKSVVVAGNATTGECASGGKLYEVEGSAVKNKVCNGTTGFTETLPSGKTETGAWGATLRSEGAHAVDAPVSIPIPLATAPKLIFVNMMEGVEFFEGTELEELLEEAAEHGCPGFTAEGVPEAEPGNLCVYGDFMSNMGPSASGFARTKLPSGPDQVFAGGGYTPKPGGSGRSLGAGPAGTTLLMQCSTYCEGMGGWAVTAE